MTKLFPIFIFSPLLLSCHSNLETTISNNEISAQTDTVSVKKSTPETEYFKTYEGILPCPDCAGIKTTFKLSKDFQTYKLTETFLGENLKTTSTSGNLNTERGFGDDKNATVYVLNYDQPEVKQRYFLRETGKEGQLTALNKYRQKTQSSPNQVLKEIKQPRKQ